MTGVSRASDYFVGHRKATFSKLRSMRYFKLFQINKFPIPNLKSMNQSKWKKKQFEYKQSMVNRIKERMTLAKYID